MSTAHSAVDDAINDLDRLRANLKKRRAVQIRTSEDRSLVRATCLTWFNTYRPTIAIAVGEAKLSAADSCYSSIASFSDKATSWNRYDSSIKVLRRELSSLRGLTLTAKPALGSAPTTDNPPQFATLVADPAMQVILAGRWAECGKCVKAGAPLAAIVMMGGLLESLLLTRVLREPNKSPIFAAKAAPKDKKTGKPQPFQDWTLRDYIDVLAELKWITAPAKDVGNLLRDYRNYVHPHKQHSHGISLQDGDAEMFWEIAKAMVRQLLK